MERILCENCGSDEFILKDGAKYCKYCNSKYVLTEEEKRECNIGITLQDDINALIEKCRTNPSRTVKYANLILELDPHNHEAKAMLEKRKIIDELLTQCKRNPRRAKKYAKRILDIDSKNLEAMKYL